MSGTHRPKTPVSPSTAAPANDATPAGPSGHDPTGPLPDRFDVAVVGGGLSGLVAAATAARAGHAVVLFEQAAEVGGRARTRTEDGFDFNIGPHALYRGTAGLDVLRDLGVEPRAGAVGQSGSYVVKEGRLYDMPVGLRSLVASPILDWRAKLEFAAFFGTLGRLDPEPLHGLTLQEWLEQAVRSPSVRQFVKVFVRTASYVDDAATLSAGTALRQLKIGLNNALYVHGGWQTMVDDLRERAQALGAQIVSRARVADVELAGTAQASEALPALSGPQKGRAVQAVRLADGRRFEVSAAILAIPPQQASALVDGGRHPELAGWAEHAVPVRAASLDVGLRRVPRPQDSFAVGLDRPLYLSVHSRWARLAPDGGALIHVMRYLDSSAGDGEADERELEGLLDLVQPGWQHEVVTRRYLPDLVVSGALPSVRWEQGEGPRGPAVTGTSGLFVAGDWVGPDGMLADRALQSGARAGQAAMYLPILARAVQGPAA